MTGGGNLQGVRNAMTGAGMDNAKIGFNPESGYVTYNGQNFLAPDNVTDGVSYASSDAINRALGDYYKNQGMLGVRDTLNARGISDSRIGWNAQTGMVTIDGRDAFKPSANAGGTTYADAKDINRLTDTAYANAGDPISLVTDYVSNQGLGNAVNWSDGKLTVGGIDVPVSYVQDGKAYARQSDIDRAIKQAKINAGITGNREVVRALRRRIQAAAVNLPAAVHRAAARQPKSRTTAFTRTIKPASSSRAGRGSPRQRFWARRRKSRTAAFTMIIRLVRNSSKAEGLRRRC